MEDLDRPDVGDRRGEADRAENKTDDPQMGGQGGLNGLASQTTGTAAGSFGLSGAVEVVEMQLVSLPDVTGLQLVEARARLMAAGLRAVVPNSLARDADVVRGQSPKPRRVGPIVQPMMVEPDTEVTLDPVVARIPDVVKPRLTLSQASTLLHGEDFSPVQRGEELLESDRVTGQEPRPGAELPRGGEVRLSCELPVPSVTRLRCPAAEAKLAEDEGHFRAEFTDEPLADDVVYAQQPRAGKPAAPRSVVRLVPYVRVPNVVGMCPDEAAATLAAQGLVMTPGMNRTVTTVVSTMDGASKVRFQSPLANSTVAHGSTVRVDVQTLVHQPPRLPASPSGTSVMVPVPRLPNFPPPRAPILQSPGCGGHGGMGGTGGGCQGGTTGGFF